ncbi:hypothetical protein [Flavobacterium sp. UBA7663]|uniref:hypothetical protein n=1 Tax=Flavobacterium sp. UBA7663 TaxID=1946557 RepID=UPI0025C1E4BC|nr:hypothetical protein [Flavobacterium sp. UBA7663]
MSIIIAKIENNQCLFLSDTKVSINNGDKSITGENKLRMSPDQGVLKIHILNPKICIAYAGNVELSANIIQSLIKTKPALFIDTIKHIQNTLILENDPSEFIVCLVSDINKPSLFKIDKNNYELGSTFWIGEKEAFNEFQSFFLKPENKHKSILNNSSTSFSQMINNTNIDTIGDFIISASYDTFLNAFQYEIRSEVFGGNKTTTIKQGKTQKLSEGTVQDGSFIVSNLISNNPNKQAICLYFAKGKTGYLYIPISEESKTVKPIKYTNVNREELNNIVLNDYGIKLIGYEINDGIIKFT